MKSKGYDKHDMEVYIKYLIGYCTMQNCYDASKENDAEEWVKADKAMACLRESFSPTARTICKYILGLWQKDLTLSSKLQKSTTVPVLVCLEKGKST